MPPDAPKPLGALRCEGLSFAYGPRTVLAGLDAAFAPGAVTAVLGPNGCGKSTLLRILLGALTPRAGRVFLGAAPVSALAPQARADRIAFIAQRPEVWAAFTVREVVAFGRYALGASAVAVAEALSRMDLESSAEQPVASLSEGQRQRVAIARVLAQFHHPGQGPRAVLADEPIAAMDPRHALHALGVLRSLATPSTAVVVVLHDLTLAREQADTVFLLNRSGALAAAGPAPEVLTPANLEAVFETPFRTVSALAARSSPAQPSAF